MEFDMFFTKYLVQICLKYSVHIKLKHYYKRDFLNKMKFTVNSFIYYEIV